MAHVLAASMVGGWDALVVAWKVVLLGFRSAEKKEFSLAAE